MANEYLTSSRLQSLARLATSLGTVSSHLTMSEAQLWATIRQ